MGISPKARGVRISDDEWHELEQRAQREGMRGPDGRGIVGQLVRRVLREYLATDGPPHAFARPVTFRRAAGKSK